MAFKIISRLSAFTRRVESCSSAFSSVSSRLTVEHDRHNLRFTVIPSTGAGPQECAVLQYKFTGEKEVDLMSTFVPETCRGQGVAALLSQAAMDFLVEENLKAHISCWYIKKYIDEHPEKHYEDLIVPDAS